MSDSNEINLPAPPGFQGLRDHLPVEIYFRHLPHWRQEGATYFVTFRQADALPAAKARELAAIRNEWERKNPEPSSDANWQEAFKIAWQFEENCIDQNHGTCRLQNPAAAVAVVDALHYFDGRRYELGCFVVMSNHVHVILRPLIPAEYPLETILKSWKRHTARQINQLFEEQGTFWQEESFDRIVRDDEHLYRCVQYIGRNPRKCGRDPASCHLWLRPEWQQLGWRFEEDITFT